jgi:hypothetical protein
VVDEAGVVASVLLKVSLSFVIAVVAREIQRASNGIDVRWQGRESDPNQGLADRPSK